MDFPIVFQTAFAKIVMVYESLKWNVIPGDSGGETLAGVSRNNWPHLPLWILVDAAKQRSVDMHTFQASDDPEIFRQVKQFYFDEFWKKAGCEYLGEFAAIEQFDTAVNCGVGTAVRHLQEILNAMNGNQKRWPDIPTDGKFGASTIAALRLFLSHNWVSSVGRVNSDLFMEKLINHKQAQRYFAIMANKPDQERFALSWMVRT